MMSMISMLLLDQIVHGELYDYGLQFNRNWAESYWTLTKIIFALGWFNIIAAIGVHLYSLAFKRKEVQQLVTAVQEEINRERTAQHQKPREPPILPGLPEKEYLNLANPEPQHEPTKQEIIVTQNVRTTGLKTQNPKETSTNDS